MNHPEEDYLRQIVDGIVDFPDDVEIGRVVDGMGTLLTVQAHDEDTGKIIGVAGATAKAIRLLLRAFGMKNNCHVSIKIVDRQHPSPRRLARPLEDEINRLLS